MLTCLNWYVALSFLVNITNLAVIEALPENVFQRHYSEHRTESLQKKDENKTYEKSKSQKVEMRIPACSPKKHYVTSYISETLAVRSHCVQKVTYSSNREVISSSTECEGYMCNPKIPYEYSKDDVYSNVDNTGNVSSIPKIIQEHSNNDSYGNVETLGKISSIPFENYTLPEEPYPGNDQLGYRPPEHYSADDFGNISDIPKITYEHNNDESYDNVETIIRISPVPLVNYVSPDETYLGNDPLVNGLLKRYSVDPIGNFSSAPNNTYKSINDDSNSNVETISNPPSDPYINYSLPVESNIVNYPPGYGPPKQYSIVGSSNGESKPPLGSFETNSFPKDYNSVDSVWLKSDTVTPDTTPYPSTSTTTISYNAPSSNRNYIGLLNNLTSTFQKGFLEGFLRKTQIASTASPTVKPTYFTAVVKDPGPASPSSYVSFSSQTPQITSQSSPYQPTSLDLSFYPE